MGKLVDLTGAVYGRWSVLERVPSRGGKAHFRCRCSCGAEKEVDGGSLRAKSSTSCGCSRIGFVAKKAEDLSGRTFGSWVVLRRGPDLTTPNSGPAVRFVCRCACGVERDVLAGVLRAGKSKSCGCRANKYAFGMAAKTNLIRSYRRGAHARGYDFLISEELFFKLVISKCHYCGVAPEQEMVTGGGIFLYNGVDRVDNQSGYIPGNVVACCSVCNKAKHTMSRDDFLDWIIRVVKNYFPPPGDDRYNLEAAYDEQFFQTEVA